MRLFVLLFLFTSFGFSSAAQSILPQAETDSLLQLWHDDAAEDSVRLTAVKKLAWDGYLFSQPDSAEYYFSLMRDYARERNIERWEVTAVTAMGVSYAVRGRLDTAILLYEQSMALSKKIGYKKGYAGVLNNLSLAHDQLGEKAIAEEYLLKSIELKKEFGDSIGVAQGYNNLSIRYRDAGDYQASLEYCLKALKIYEVHGGNERSILAARNSLGLTYQQLGDYAKAIEIHMSNLRAFEESGNLAGITASLSNAASLYEEQEEYDEATKFYERAIEIAKESDNPEGVVNGYNNIGRIHKLLGDLTKAEEMYILALKLSRENRNLSTEAIVLHNMGSIRQQQGKSDEAIAYFNQALEIKKKLGDKGRYAFTVNELALVYYKLGDYAKAIRYSSEAMDIYRETGFVGDTRHTAFNLYQSYKATGRKVDALEMYETFIEILDSVNSEENQRAILQQNYRYQYEKQAAADSVRNAEQQKVVEAELLAEQVENKRRQQESYFLYAGVAITLIFGIFIFNRFRVTRRQRDVIDDQRKVVEQQKSEVEAQKAKVDAAYDELEEKNTEILDSITYAKRIQSAILPPDKIIKSHLENSFILYKPKDIVAGDFYWLEAPEQEGQQTEYVFLAAADCTGHGVPGALVSVVCNNGLNRSVREYGLDDPGQILNKTRELVVSEFEKAEEDVKDGMDIALVKLERSGDGATKLTFAGAHNPLWIVRTDGIEIEEIKGDKQPVGKFEHSMPYTSHEVELNSGDTFYLFSDGFADQFGGEKGKKFKSASFKKLLLSLKGEPMDVQYNRIDETFESWRGQLQQLDDVCVIGVRV